MKKLITIILLIFMLVSKSFAFVPLVIPSWYLGASVAMLSSTAGLYYAMKSGFSADVSSLGTMTRAASAAYVSLSTVPMSVVEKSLNALISYDKVMELSEKKLPDNTYKYPKVNAATHTGSAPVTSVASGSNGTLSGSYVNIGGNLYQLDAYNATYNGYGPTGDYGVQFIQGFIGIPIAGSEGGGYVSLAKYYYHSISTSPPPVRKQMSDSIFTLTNSSNGGTIASNYAAEIDAMYQDDDYVPVFTDASTGLPYSAPPGIASPAQIDAYNSSQQVKDAASVAAASASAAATNARDAWIASGGDPVTGLGGDPALKQKYLDAQSAADSAAATSASVTAAQAEKDISVSAPSAPAAYGTETFDFGNRLDDFMKDMKTSSLFGMPSQILGNLPSGGTSVFNLNFGRFGQTTFDLASYGNAIAIIRVLVLFVFSVSCVRIITLKGGSG